MTIQETCALAVSSQLKSFITSVSAKGLLPMQSKSMWLDLDDTPVDLFVRYGWCNLNLNGYESKLSIVISTIVIAEDYRSTGIFKAILNDVIFSANELGACVVIENVLNTRLAEYLKQQQFEPTNSIPECYIMRFG